MMRFLTAVFLLWFSVSSLWLVPSFAANDTPAAPAKRKRSSSGCASSSNIAETENSIVLRAEQLEYFQEAKRLVAQGNVSVTRAKERLLADHLDMNTETGVGTAEGNVRLTSPEEDIYASQLEFDLSSKRGILHDAKGILGKTRHMVGERVERLDERRFVVEGGRITACSGLIPDWEFRSRHARITLEEYAVMREPSFWIKGIPVFYLPYLVVPIKKERATGFLPPHVGYSETDGGIVGGQFFWAMTDWMDSTLGFEYFTNKGIKPEVEWRYRLDPLSDGILQGAVIREQDTGDVLWRMLLKQQQEFGWDVRGISQIDMRSERDLVRRFARSSWEESAIRTASFGALTKLFADASLMLSGASFDGPPGTIPVQQQFRRLPALRFDQFATPLFGPVFFAVDASYSRLSDPSVVDNATVQRLDVFPQIIVPVQIAPWLRFTGTAGLRETLYDRRTEGDGQGERTLADLRAYVQGPALWRRYPHGAKGGALIHVIETQLDYRYVPRVAQGDLPYFETLDDVPPIVQAAGQPDINVGDAAAHFLDPLETLTFIDRVAAVNYAKLAVVQRVFRRTARAADNAGLRQVARLEVSQGLNIQEATQGNGHLLGPLDLNAELRLWQPWRLEASLRFDTATALLQEIAWRGNVSLSSRWTFKLENYQRHDPDINYVIGGLQWQVIGGLNVGYSAYYNAVKEEFHSHRVVLTYQTECWFVTANVHIPRGGDTTVVVRANILNF